LSFSSVYGSDICFLHILQGFVFINLLCLAGSEGFDKIFTPDRLSRGASPASIAFSPSSYLVNESPQTTMESTVTSLKEALLDSQAKLAALITDLSISESSIQHLADIKQLSQKLEIMQSLVMQLQTKI
jgi:hypothetical protein